jgi:hypothetical protein
MYASYPSSGSALMPLMVWNSVPRSPLGEPGRVVHVLVEEGGLLVSERDSIAFVILGQGDHLRRDYLGVLGILGAPLG